jgi:putative ABC transport system permease protein
MATDAGHAYTFSIRIICQFSSFKCLREQLQMFRSYALVAFRRLLQEKLYFLVTVLSLALGIASFLILTLYLRSELTYDQHFTNSEHIYRVTWNVEKDGGGEYAITAPSVGPLLLGDYPEFTDMVQFRVSRQNVFEANETQKHWDRVFLADPSVFDVFSHDISRGDPRTALADPYSIAISESFAQHYFGDENPIGRKVLSGGMAFAVTLVFADLPENTHLKYDALLPLSLMQVFAPGFFDDHIKSLDWLDDRYTYVEVSPQIDQDALHEIAQDFVNRYMRNLEAESGIKYAVRFQPLTDVHYDDQLLVDLPSGNIFYVYVFAAVATFILLVGCINYTNLATARASKRAREIGMRRVLGATRPQLIGQFLGESLMFTGFGMVVALLIIKIVFAATPIGALMGNETLLIANIDANVLFGAMLLGLSVALIAGIYPAFYLSAIPPLAAITTFNSSWQSGIGLRRILVWIQLVIGISVIACTLLMIEQVRYLEEKPLGFDTENRLIITLRDYDAVRNLTTIKNELRKLDSVVDVVTIDRVPGTGNSFIVIPTETNTGGMESLGAHRLDVGINFVEAMNVDVIQGRGFSAEIVADEWESVLVNQSLVRHAGWDNPIGKRFQYDYGPAYVVGVVEDFHYSALHNVVGPLLIHPVSDSIGDIPKHRQALISRSIIVVVSEAHSGEAMLQIENTVRTFSPSYIFQADFLDDRLGGQYRSESNLIRLTGIFAATCILICIIGLFGLTAFSTEQRTKEIGIRKVLGASDFQIVTMLSRHILFLVLIAAIPASIVSYLVLERWLQRFSYHIDIGWQPFVAATLIVTIITLLTVVALSLKASRARVADNLRYE